MKETDLAPKLEMIKALHRQAKEGKTFKDLAPRLASFQRGLQRHRRTIVSLPAITETGQAILEQLVSNLKNDQLTELSDTQLELLLTQLANEDPAVRFGEATLLFNGALANDLLTKDQLRHAINTLKKWEILFDHIEEPINKGAVRRVSAVTGLASLLYADRAGYFFVTKADLSDLIDRVALGMLWEHDNRGYVNRLGWIQLFGEYTVLVGELCRRRELVRGEKVFLMATYLVAYRQLKAPLIMGEADEGADFLIEMMNQHPVYRRYFMVFLRDWQRDLQQERPQSEQGWHQVFNYRRLMQALLMSADLPEIIARQITNQSNQDEQ